MESHRSVATSEGPVENADLASLVERYLQNDPDVCANPYPLFRRLHESARVFRSTDKVLISTYAEGRQLLSDPSVLQGLSVAGSRYQHAYDQRGPEDRSKLEMTFDFLEKRLGGANGERHARLRKLAQRAFTRRQVEGMRDRVYAIVDAMLEDLPRDEPTDFVSGFAYHVPLIVVCEMLDIPTDGRESLRQWSGNLGRFLGADWGTTDLLEPGYRSVFELREYLTGVFEEHRHGETTDLMGSLIAAEGEDGDRFSQDELVAMILQFVFAGHETTTNLIANAMTLFLGEHRDQWEAIRDNPALIPSAVEEVLRYESPTQMIDKIASEDMQIGGVDLHPGDSIGVLLGAANRDVAVFEDPDRFDITRTGTSNISFGFGAHHCIGAGLARMEATVALDVLSRRFPDMQLATDAIEWQPTPLLRGPETLPVVMGPDRG